MSHPASSTSTSNPNKRSSSPHSSAAAAAAPIHPAMKKAKSQPLDGSKNGQQHNTPHVHFSDPPALSPMIEDDPNDAVLEASSPSSAFGRTSASSGSGVTANLSRKKATLPQPTKKLVIKLNKGLFFVSIFLEVFVLLFVKFSNAFEWIILVRDSDFITRFATVCA